MIFLSDIETAFRFQSSYSGVDHYKVTISFTITLGTLTIAEDLIPVLVDGYYYVIGLKELVQAYMELNDYSLFDLILNARAYNAEDEWMEELDDISISVEVLYNSLKYKGSASTIVNARFMSRRTTAVIAKKEPFVLHWENGTAGDTFKVVYLFEDGSTDTDTVKSRFSSGSVAIGRSAREDLVSARATYGNREMTVYFQNQPEPALIRFRNMFNVEEYMTLPCSIEENPSTDFEEAVIGNVSRQYDIEHELEWTLKTPPLTAAQMDVTLEMVRSRLIRLYRGLTDEWVTVLVKSYKLVKSNEPNTPQAAQITFVPAAYDDKTAMA